MPESFYDQQLNKKLEGSRSVAYRQFVDDKGRPISLINLKLKTKSIKCKPLPNMFRPKMQTPVKKACKNCEEMFEWDHKHSRKEFDAQQFCNKHCKHLYYARPKENA